MQWTAILKGLVLLSAVTLVSPVFAADEQGATDAEQTRRVKLTVVAHVQEATRTVSRRFSGPTLH